MYIQHKSREKGFEDEGAGRYMKICEEHSQCTLYTDIKMFL